MHGWRIGRIFGINIEIDVSWLIIFGLFLWFISTEIADAAPETSQTQLWITAVITTFLFFACLLLHELAHSLMANRLGADVSRITLFIFGGAAQMSREPDRPWAEFKIAIVGPLTSVALGGVFFALFLGAQEMGAPRVWSEALRWVATINVVLAVFNMLPGFPLDGGRVLRSILWAAWGSLERATKFASSAGQFFGYAMAGLGFLSMIVAGNILNGIWLIALGWLLSSAAAGSYQQLQIRRALGDVYVHDLMSSPVRTIPADASLNEAAHDYFMEARFTAFAVEDAGEIVGTVRMEDLQEVPREQWDSTRVREVTRELDRETMTINSDEEAVDALMQMARNDLGRLLVTDHSGEIVAIISHSDLVRLIKVKSGLGR